MLQYVVFYHDDMDGRCAASLLNFDTGIKEPKYFIPYDYSKPFMEYIDQVPKYSAVWILDLSLKEADCSFIRALRTNECEIVWIDHHKTSLDASAASKNSEGSILDRRVSWTQEHYILHHLLGKRSTKYCGARLTFEYLHGTCSEVPEYIKLVDDYDRWKYEFGDTTTHFKLGMDANDSGPASEIWHLLLNDYFEGREKSIHSTLNMIAGQGHLIKHYVDEQNRDHFEYSFEVEFEGHKCIAINRSSNSWIFGEAYNQYEICIPFYFNGPSGVYQFSLFSSNPDVDCAKIAEKYGGGGHRGASGFASTYIPFNLPIK